jgi:hypothetical protein
MSLQQASTGSYVGTTTGVGHGGGNGMMGGGTMGGMMGQRLGIGKRSDWQNLANSNNAEDSGKLYARLGREIMSLYCGHRNEWSNMAKASIATIGPKFNTQRMVQEYLGKWHSRSG